MCTVLHILACGKSGGIETLVSEYARESSHDNHFVFVWEDGYYEKKIREGGCSTYFLDAGKTGSFNATQELIKIVTNVKPDVIITHHGSPMISDSVFFKTKPAMQDSPPSTRYSWTALKPSLP